MLTLPSSLVRSSATSPVRVSVKLTAERVAALAAAGGFIWLAGSLAGLAAGEWLLVEVCW